MGIEPGTLIAKRYRVLRELGKGGMGEVFAAENTRTGRQVALKVLRAEAKAKASAIERFRREAKAAGAIRSDYVTQVLDVEDDPEHGIVLVFELLEGESLVERLKRTGPMPFDELWTVVEAVWMGLADAHDSGVVHRDLKPSNVYLLRPRGNRPGRVKILDFGISKLPKQITTQSLTQVGQSLGTFSFMPPEQIGKAKSVDHRADIYACATLIYQALSGQLPYVAKNVVAMMELKARQEPRTLGAAMGHPVEPALEVFIAKGLARNPADRFQSAAEAVEAWRRLRPPGATSIVEADMVAAMDDDDEASRAPTAVRTFKSWVQSLPVPPDDPGALRRYLVGGQEVGPGAPNAAGDADGSAMPPESLAPTAVVRRGAQGASRASYGAVPGGPGLSGTASPEAARFDRAGSQPSAPSPYVPVALDPRTSGMQLDVGHRTTHGRPRNRTRMALALVLGAVGLMLVGFGIVALAMQLLQ